MSTPCRAQSSASASNPNTSGGRASPWKQEVLWLFVAHAECCEGACGLTDWSPLQYFVGHSNISSGCPVRSPCLSGSGEVLNDTPGSIEDASDTDVAGTSFSSGVGRSKYGRIQGAASLPCLCHLLWFVWFPPITPLTSSIVPACTVPPKHRRAGVRVFGRIVRRWKQQTLHYK